MKFLPGGDTPRARKRMNWCNSSGDSTGWMREVIIYSSFNDDPEFRDFFIEEVIMDSNTKNSKLRKWQKGILAFLFLAVGLAAILLAYFESEWNKSLIYAINIVGTIILFVGICFFIAFLQHGKEIKSLTVKQMTMVAIQSAITVILYYFVKINLPIFPGFLDIQVSEIPALITSFAYGPYVGCLIILIRFIIKLPATITAGVGEVADLLIGCTLIITTGLIYKKHRTFKGALVGTEVGVFVATVVACLANWLILIPAYVQIAHFPLSAIVGMCSMIPGITEANFMPLYIFVGVLPFNLFRFIIVFALTFLLYKRVHKLIIRLTEN